MLKKPTPLLYLNKLPENIAWYETNIFDWDKFLEYMKINKMTFWREYKGNKGLFGDDINKFLFNFSATTDKTNVTFTTYDIQTWVKKYFNLPLPTPELFEQARISKDEYLKQLRRRNGTNPSARFLVTRILNFYGIYKSHSEYIETFEQHRAKFKMYATKLHKLSERKGFYDYPPSEKLTMGLILTEVGEAIEALRNSFDMYYLSNGKPEGFMSELTDIVIRIMDYWGYKDKKEFVFPTCIENYDYSIYDNKPAEFAFDIGGLLYARDLESIVIHIKNYMEHHDFKLYKLIDEKYRYNKTRPIKHNKIF